MAAVPLNQAYLLKSTGREYGPDIALKVIPGDMSGLKILRKGTYPIKDDSSITEVLNVIAFLCNVNRGQADSDSIEKTMSIADDGKYGLHTTATGVYADEGLDGNTGAGPQAIQTTAGTLYGGIAAQPFNLITLVTVTALQTEFFPQGLMKRSGDADANTKLYPVSAAHQLAAGDTVPLMSNAILQAIHILERTREILGPKGWTDLFKKIKGGAKQNKNHTHRRHRRRYSSKQY
jgi:hypothetical protein